MEQEKDNAQALQEIAEAISDFRREFWQSLEKAITDEVADLDQKGFDPTRGRGRGPKWADGA